MHPETPVILTHELKMSLVGFYHPFHFQKTVCVMLQLKQNPYKLGMSHQLCVLSMILV